MSERGMGSNVKFDLCEYFHLYLNVSREKNWEVNKIILSLICYLLYFIEGKRLNV